jgi:hypothetical protein
MLVFVFTSLSTHAYHTIVSQEFQNELKDESTKATPTSLKDSDDKEKSKEG